MGFGALRFFNQPVPDMTTDYTAFRTYFDFVFWQMRDLQLALIDQPTVFGYEPYYQTGYSKIWMNTTTIALRNDYTDAFIWRWLTVKPGYKLGIDLVAWATSLQPNFSDVSGTPAISCVDVLNGFSKNLYARDLYPSQKDFLIDTIMMQGIPRTSWTFEWNAYRNAPTDTNKKNTVTWRLQNLMKYMLRMAEYHIF